MRNPAAAVQPQLEINVLAQKAAVDVIVGAIDKWALEYVIGRVGAPIAALWLTQCVVRSRQVDDNYPLVFLFAGGSGGV